MNKKQRNKERRWPIVNERKPLDNRREFTEGGVTEWGWDRRVITTTV